VDVAAANARGDHEIALDGGVGDVGEDAAGLGGSSDFAIDGAVVGGREDERGAGEVGGAEGAAVEADGERIEIGEDLGGDDGDARAGFEETIGFAERDFSGADDENWAILKV